MSRRSNELGRYESPVLDRDDMEKFLQDFAAFLENDGRHHLWIHSQSGDAPLVYDKHNILYAYGPIDRFIGILTRRGLTEGEIDLPAPHVHHYHTLFDDEEDALLALWDWHRTPLRPGDED